MLELVNPVPVDGFFDVCLDDLDDCFNDSLVSGTVVDINIYVCKTSEVCQAYDQAKTTIEIIDGVRYLRISSLLSEYKVAGSRLEFSIVPKVDECPSLVPAVDKPDILLTITSKWLDADQNTIYLIDEFVEILVGPPPEFTFAEIAIEDLQTGLANELTIIMKLANNLKVNDKFRMQLPISNKYILQNTDNPADIDIYNLYDEAIKLKPVITYQGKG